MTNRLSVSHLSIRALLIISILLPLVIVYAFSMMIDIRNSREDAIHNVQVHLMDLVNKNAALVDTYFIAAAQIPQMLSAIVATDRMQDGEDYDALLREMLTTFPRLVGSCIALEPNVFRDGLERFAPYVHRTTLGSTELLSADLAQTYKEDYTTWDWYRIPKETGQGIWSEPYFDEGGGDVLMCTYSVPIFRGGKFVGVATVDIGLDDLQELIDIVAEKDVRHYLLSATGQYVIASDPQLDLAMKETIFSAAAKYNSEPLAQVGRDMLQGKAGLIAYNRIMDDRRVWIAYAPLPITGWHLKLAMDETKVLEPVYESIYGTIRHFLVEFTVIFIVIIFVSSRLAIPIKRLAAFARKLAAGDLDAHAGDIRFAKEIDQLSHTFDKMVVDLKSNIAQRIKEEAVRQVVEGELKAARRIQASLLPRIFPPFPEQKEFDLHAMNEPVAFIAGDFFDFFFIKPDTLAFVIADVSGHGVPAALFMAVSRTIMRTFSTPERSPREVIDHVNRVLNTDNDDMMFVTLFYGHYDIKTGDLTYVNAGHNPPYIVSKDGRLETLSATGSLVATFEDISYDEQTIRMEPGDLLVTYTDGVTEAHSGKDHHLYGEERLEQLLYEIRNESVEEICDQIYRDADQFAEHECQDDVTILVLRRNETTSA